MNVRNLLKNATLATACVALAVTAAMATEVPMSGPVAAGFHPMKHKQDKDKKAADAVDEVQLFPKATRKEPKVAASEAMHDKLVQLPKLEDAKKYDEMIALAQQVAGDAAANGYDRAIADRAIADAYIDQADYGKAIGFVQKALDENALSNNDQYQMMLQLAQMQVAEDQNGPGIATLDRLIAETGEDKPEYEAQRGIAFYKSKQYPDAIAAIKKAMAGTDKPKENWARIMVASYSGLNQPQEAARYAEEFLEKNPGDKDMMLNLSSLYLEDKQPEKAAAVLDDARHRGLLTDEHDYKQLYSLYGNIKGREKDSIAVINEGLQKGVLKPDAGLYTTLAQDYYFSGQNDLAIDAYRKADAASSDGEAALNLAKIYSLEGRKAEAKTTAELALRKGVSAPNEARVLTGQSNPTPVKPHGKK